MSYIHCSNDQGYQPIVDVSKDGGVASQHISHECYADYFTVSTEGYAIAHDRRTRNGETCNEFLIRLLNVDSLDYRTLNIGFLLTKPRLGIALWKNLTVTFLQHASTSATNAVPTTINTATATESVSTMASAATTTAGQVSSLGMTDPSSEAPAMMEAERTIREQKNALIIVSSLLGATVVIITLAIVIIVLQQRKLSHLRNKVQAGGPG